MTAIPDEIMRDIRDAAQEFCADEPEMQESMIEAETEAYRGLLELDFGAAAAVRERIMADAEQFFSSWEDMLSAVETEIDAFTELQGLRPDDVPGKHLDDLRAAAELDHSDYASQLDYVRNGVASFRYVRETRSKIEPIRDLLIRMEAIIGEECYNANIQNYSAWGMWEGEGRSFRYPVTFVAEGKEIKRRTRPTDVQAETLVTGHYKFGANELSIYRALSRVVEMLESEYGLQLPAKIAVET